MPKLPVVTGPLCCTPLATGSAATGAGGPKPLNAGLLAALLNTPLLGGCNANGDCSDVDDSMPEPLAIAASPVATAPVDAPVATGAEPGGFGGSGLGAPAPPVATGGWLCGLRGDAGGGSCEGCRWKCSVGESGA